MTAQYDSLNPEKALIWRLAHRDNLTWTFANGLHSAASTTRDPNFIAIGNADLIQKRTSKAVPIAPYGTLEDYVPFYFTPFTPMMYNILTGHGVAKKARAELVLLVSSVSTLVEQNVRFVFTDGHAYMATTNFYNAISDLAKIDWQLLQRRDFKRDNNDPRKLERYQAEALIQTSLPVSALIGVICYDEATATSARAIAEQTCVDVDVHVRPGWYL